MALGDVIARLSVQLGMDTAAFEKGATLAEKRLNQTAKRFDAIGKSMVGLGKTLSFSVTAPLVAFGVLASKAATESAQAIGQVEAALKSMGPVAGRTAEQLEQQAKALQHLSTFDDDEILRKVTANLLTFGNVSGEVFDRAQKAAVNLSARLGQDLQASTIQLGKALNDPIKGITALRRVGVAFTAQQIEQIKAMVAVGNAAGAQGLILNELEKEFGGAAKAARDATPGADTVDAWRDFQEIIGDIVNKALPPLTAFLSRVLNAFNDLSPGMQKVIVAGAAIAAVVGPLLIVFGSLVGALGTITAAMAPFLAALSVAFAEGGILIAGKAAVVGLTAAFGPFLIPIAAVAAAGLLIYKNWGTVGPILESIGKQVSEKLGPAIAALAPAVREFAAAAQGLAEKLAPLATALIGLEAAILKPFGPVALQAIQVFIKTFSNALGFLTKQIGSAAKLMQGDFVGAFKDAIGSVNALFGGLPKAAVQAVQELVLGVTHWIVDRLGAVWNKVKAQVELVKQAFFFMKDAVVGHSYIPDMVDAIAAQMARLDDVMVDKAKSATERTKAQFEKLGTDVQAIMEGLFPDAREIADRAKDFATLRAGIAAGGAGGFTVGQLQQGVVRKASGGAIDNLTSMFGGGISKIGAGFSGVAEQMGDLGASLAEGVLAQRDKFRELFQTTFGDGIIAALHGNFKDFLRSFFGSIFERALRGALNNLADALSGAISGKSGSGGGLLGSIIGIGVSALGGGGLSKGALKLQGFASGSMSASRGLALVGERGPELVNFGGGERVFSNDNTRGMMRGNTIVMNNDFRGADAHAVAAISAKLDHMQRNLKGEIIGTVGDAFDRRIIRRG